MLNIKKSGVYIVHFAFPKNVFFCEKKAERKKERKGENVGKKCIFSFCISEMWGFFVKKRTKAKRKGKRGKEREKNGETDGKKIKKVGKEGFFLNTVY